MFCCIFVLLLSFNKILLFISNFSVPTKEKANFLVNQDELGEFIPIVVIRKRGKKLRIILL